MTRSDAIRAFVALEIPDEIKAAIRREQRALAAELPRARWTRPEGQHLTLKFLGETSEEPLRLLAAKTALAVAGLPPVIVRFGGGGFFPSSQRPRVAWLGGEARGGRELAAAVEAVAVGRGFPAERRPWALHLTQARLDRSWPRSAVERFLDWGRTFEAGPFECAEAVLFRSELRPGGAVYTALERFPLG